MRYLPKLLIFSFILLVNSLHSQANSISKENFRVEMILFKSLLENQHPNLYTYRTAIEFDYVIDSIANQLTDRIDMQEAYHHIAYLAGYIQDGHLFVHPSAAHILQFQIIGPIFPFDIFFDGQHMNIIKDYTKEDTIPLGSEIKAINGVSVDSMFQFIVHRMQRDGNNFQYPTHAFYQFFPAFYSFFYGFPDSFEIDYIDENQILRSTSVAALPMEDAIEVEDEHGKGVYLEIDSVTNVATLQILSFDNTILASEYDQFFRIAVKRAFKRINESNIDKLVIDLRDNQGGHVNNGTYLLRHLAKKRTRYIHSIYTLSIDEKTNKRVFKTKGHISTKKRSSKRNRFDGDVFLFTNGGSFSCSSIVANAFKKEKLGLIIGEMTGGSSSVHSGGPNKEITLPYSKIVVTIPLTKFQLNELESTKAKGVIPDIEIKDHYTRFIGGEDPFMNEVLKH